MTDRRWVEDLSAAELEEALILKRRDERISRFGEAELPPSDAAPGHLERRLRGPQKPSGEAVGVESFLYDLDGVSQADEGSRRSQPQRDKLLLIVEYLAVFGLLSIMIFTFFNVRAMNRELANDQADQVATFPTAQPTPLFRVVVLPGGHTPPTAPEGARPNYDEVPPDLRPIVEQQFAGPVIIPTPGPTNAIRIKIPAIDVDAAIVQGDSWEQLKKGVGQHLGTPDPGQSGNLFLSAHNDIYGEIFRNLDQLVEGDQIVVFTQTAEYVYQVVNTIIVSPTDVDVLSQTQEPIISLLSCYPYLVNTDRIVVIGELVG